MTRWAVITGAAHGIGAAFSKNLSKNDDFHVLCVDIDAKGLEETRQFDPSRLHTLHSDVADKDIAEKIDAALPEDAELYILFQNAAVAPVTQFHDITREEVDYVMTVNMTSPLMIAQKLLPRLQKTRGRILHNSAVTAHRNTKHFTSYCLSKACFHMLYKQLNVELEGTGVLVASVLPGSTETKTFWHSYTHLKALKSPGIVEYFDKLIAGKQLRTPEFTAWFLRYILLETSDREFSEKEWSAFETHHHEKWHPKAVAQQAATPRN